MHWMNGFGGGFMMIFWWGLLILGIVALVKWLMGQNQSSHGGDSPLEILKRRYARGEISKKEFEELKKDLI
ncbi:MAG: SHOCT domain-containing protein [Calditrichaeota bacterium]|nr:MAG: SHOCT domain-containing protein [Calditrichota bacterium]